MNLDQRQTRTAGVFFNELAQVLHLPRRVVIGVIVATLGPSLLWFLGRATSWIDDPGLSIGLESRGHVVLVAVAALLALTAAVFALIRALLGREIEMAVLFSILLPAALFDGYHSLLGTGTIAELSARSGGLDLSWWIGRMFLACALILGVRVLTIRSLRSRTTLGVVVGILSAGCILIAFTVANTLPQLRTASNLVTFPLPLVGSLLPIGLFVVAGLWVFPAFRRHRPSILSHALVLSCLPLALSTLQLIGGTHVELGLGGLIGHGQMIVAYGLILFAMILDYGRSQQHRRDTLLDLRSTRRKLTEQTRELVRIDRELSAETRERQRAERALRMLEKAVETMSLGVTVTDVSGRIVYINPADAGMHGYEQQELLGRDSRLFVVDDQAEQHDRPDEIVRWERERMNVRKDGSRFPVRLVSDSVLDNDGEVVGLVTLCEDIGERLRIRSGIESRDRILQAVGFAAEVFLAEPSWTESLNEVLGRLGRATGVDRVYIGRADTTGPSPLGSQSSWLAPESRVMAPSTSTTGGQNLRFDQWRSRLAQGEAVQGSVADLPEADRRSHEIRGVGTLALVPIFVHEAWWGFVGLEDGETGREWSAVELEALRTAVRTLAAAIQREEVSAALEASEDRYRDVLENANDLIQSVSPDGRFRYVNRAWRERLGYNAVEVDLMTSEQVIHPAFLDDYRAVMERIFSGADPGRIESVFVTRDGAQIAVEGSLDCRFVDGVPVATRGIFRDITERKAMERMKDEFVSTVSHELRTPLTSIIASLGLIEGLQAGDVPKTTRDLLAVAHRNSQRLLRLINDLLDLQKLSVGKMNFRSDPIPVSPFLQEAARGVQAYADSLNIRLLVQPVESSLVALADRDRLMQVLSNLLSNAIKFSPEGRTVVVSGSASNGGVELSVADEGPGIPVHFKDRLFDKFSQGDSTIERQAGGSGLGLSIVKALVEGMNGQVRLDERAAVGATFCIDLPAAQAVTKT